MKEKCDKFQSLFIFSDEKFKKHLEECEECRIEFEKFNKLSDIIQEAKPLYFKKRNNQYKLRAAMGMSLLLLAGTFMVAMDYNSFGIADRIKYGETLCAEEYGFPVDSYGFILVD